MQPHPTPDKIISNTREWGKRGLPGKKADGHFREISVPDAIYYLLSGSLTKGLVFSRRNTIRTIQEGLLRVFAVRVSRRHVSRLLKAWRDQGLLVEHQGRDRELPSITHATALVLSLTEPTRDIRARKWKRR
ncbi:hypothetical protein ES703_44184 [subsurface metagenome]